VGSLKPVGVAVKPVNAWTPLRHRLYRAVWTAQLVSNLGTWMQTVGAQWLMGSLGGSALEVALVQAAITLPVFLVGLPAGALGDIVDRRKLLLLSQSMMLAAAAVLAFVTFSGGATAWLLLAMTFLLGVGQGLTLPSWQAIVPELVEPREIPLAAALAGVNMNVSRAVGPAIGGALVAVAGPEWAFALNAVSFAGVVAVIARWRRPPTERPLGPERMGAAMRSGLSYALHAPKLRAVFVRAAIFVAFAGSLWALLPVLVRSDMGLGAGGYGLLLGAVGFGAVLGAVALARVQHVRSTDWLVVVASLGFGAACAVCALAPSVPAVTAALVLAGAAWITATSALNGTAIMLLPRWVSSRGLALYTLVFQGGQALSAIAWGTVAEFAGTRTALGAVAAGLVLGPAARLRWRLPSGGDLDVSPQPWPVAPEVADDPHPRTGPVLVTVEYHVLAEHHEEFRARMAEVGRARRRTGANRWGLFQDAADPDCFVESFLVSTWEEHLRQHGERSTTGDRAALEAAVALAEGEPRVRHLLYAYSDPAGDGAGFVWDRAGA
jgi:MFS family permease